jgi:hypothetical protein
MKGTKSMTSQAKGSMPKSNKQTKSSAGNFSTEDTGSLAPLDVVKSERQNRAWNTMRWFKGIPANETEFYARFETMSPEDITFLKSFYNISDDWDLFRMICKFWNIRVSDVRPRIRAGV